MNQENSPVFILGIPRAGTTLLWCLLQRFQRFAATKDPNGYHLGETKAFSCPEWLGRKNSQAKKFLVTKEAGLKIDQELSQLFKQRRMGITREAWANLYLKFRSDVPEAIRLRLWNAAGLSEHLRTYFSIAQEDRGCARLSEKTPEHIYYLPELWATYPEAKVIFCYRHPVNVLGSYRRRLEKERQQPQPRPLEWLKISPARFTNLYEERFKIADSAARCRPSQFRYVSYESLISQTSDVMRGLCGFLGEEFDEARLPVSAAKADDEGYVPAQEVVQTPRDWKAFLSESEAEFVQSNLSTLIRRLGYPIYSV